MTLPTTRTTGTATASRTVLSADEVARLLPHRYPFALIDRVTAVEPGVCGEAIKNISAADGVLAGHFPGRMIYPGVLLVECIAQLAAVIYGTAAVARAGGELVGDMAHRVGYLAEIKQAKFLKPVEVGDQVVLRAQSGPRLGSLIAVTGQASVGQDLVLKARLTVTERDGE